MTVLATPHYGEITEYVCIVSAVAIVVVTVIIAIAIPLRWLLRLPRLPDISHAGT